MNNKSYRLCDIIDESSCMLIEDDLEEFSKNAELDEMTQQRIMSSVMRKAGFEMKESITVKSMKKRSKRFIGFMAAAIIAVTGAVGAGAAYVVNHRQSIDSIFGASSGEALEQRNMINGAVYKGRHFDVSLDTVLSSGEFITVIATAVPNDEFGEELIKRNALFDLNTDIVFGSSLAEGGTGSSGIVDGNGVIEYTAALEEYTESFTLPVSAEYYDSDDDKYHRIARFDIEINKNLDSTELVSESGDVIKLCDIGYSGRNVTLGEGARDYSKGSDEPLDITFEYADGSREQFKDSSGCSEQSKNNTYYFYSIEVSFSRIIDSGRVTAVIINGIRFEKR